VPPERHQGAYGKGGPNFGVVYSIKEGGVYLLHAYVYISYMCVPKKITVIIGHLYWACVCTSYTALLLDIRAAEASIINIFFALSDDV